MSLKITNINTPCGHLELTLDIDGQSVEKRITTEEIREFLDEFPGGYRGALIAAWLTYQLENGATKSQVINIDIAPLVT